jgi:hypothetical protein
MEPHLDDNEIALFLEGGLGGPAERRLVRHLRDCDRCRQVMMDAARVVGAWQIDPDAFGPHPDILQAGAADRLVSVDRSVAGARPARWTNRLVETFSRYRRSRRWALAAAAAALIIAVFTPAVFRDNGSPVVPPRILAQIRDAVDAASGNGFIVIPGSEQDLKPRPSVYRSGYIAANDSLEISLEVLRQVFDSEHSNRDVAYWLIAGCVATGQNDLVEVLAREAGRRHPSDREILTLHALALYQDGELDQAEALLRECLESAPDDPAALIDLSLVLIDRGMKDEAVALLGRVRTDHRGTPLEDRVELISRTLISD